MIKYCSDVNHSMKKARKCKHFSDFNNTRFIAVIMFLVWSAKKCPKLIWSAYVMENRRMISLYYEAYEGHFTCTDVYHWFNSMDKPQVKLTIFERYVLKRPLKRVTRKSPSPNYPSCFLEEDDYVHRITSRSCTITHLFTHCYLNSLMTRCI